MTADTAVDGTTEADTTPGGHLHLITGEAAVVAGGTTVPDQDPTHHVARIPTTTERGKRTSPNSSRPQCGHPHPLPHCAYQYDFHSMKAHMVQIEPFYKLYLSIITLLQ